ncbi:hypothetical protein FRB90_003497 [Tulasnella sp. 427]|nr:hypothetical protein FRB90_003497 [Tulasnella sp. 427]
MPPHPSPPLLPAELKMMVVEYVFYKPALAALIRAHSSFKTVAEKRLYHYIEVADDNPVRTIMCLQSVISRPKDLALYVRAVFVKMVYDFEKWFPMGPLFTQALIVMRNLTKMRLDGYKGVEEAFLQPQCCVDSLVAYSGKAFLSAARLEHLSRNAPGLVKMEIGTVYLNPTRTPIWLELGARHRKTLRHLRINLAHATDQDAVGIVATIARTYPNLKALHIQRDPLEETQAPLDEDRVYVAAIHDICPTVRQIELTRNRGPWRYSENEGRWLLRAEIPGDIPIRKLDKNKKHGGSLPTFKPPKNPDDPTPPEEPELESSSGPPLVVLNPRVIPPPLLVI